MHKYRYLDSSRRGKCQVIYLDQLAVCEARSWLVKMSSMKVWQQSETVGVYPIPDDCCLTRY